MAIILTSKFSNIAQGNLKSFVFFTIFMSIEWRENNPIDNYVH